MELKCSYWNVDVQLVTCVHQVYHHMLLYMYHKSVSGPVVTFLPSSKLLVTRMLSQSNLVTSIATRKGERGDGKNDSLFWIVCGSLKKKSMRQVWRERLANLKLADFHRVATLGVGAFGR